MQFEKVLIPTRLLVFKIEGFAETDCSYFVNDCTRRAVSVSVLTLTRSLLTLVDTIICFLPLDSLLVECCPLGYL